MNKQELVQGSNPKILVHSIEYPIRWGDMDAYGHVNNTMYFLYVQEARFSMLTSNNIKIGADGISPVLAETTCKFIKPIRFPETLIIDSYVLNMSDKKVVFEHEIKSKSNSRGSYAILTATVKWFDFINKTSCVIPQYIVDILREHK